jgi:lipopolysaccharide biosynthesis regulator YciM
MIPLVASELVRLGKATNQLAPARTLLQDAYQQPPSIDIADALVQADLSEGVPALQARRGYVDHMAHEPSLIAAARWLNPEPFTDDDTRKALQGSLEHAVRPLARYRCAACGFEAQGYFWQCPGCQAWESFPPRRIEEL